MHRRTPGRALVAGGVGNVVEWYDPQLGLVGQRRGQCSSLCYLGPP
jgi:hypothetical protein